LGSSKKHKEKVRIATVLIFIAITSNLTSAACSYLGRIQDAKEELQLLCIDAKGEYLEGANVTIRKRGGALVYSGLTNSTGWISTSLPVGSYIVQVYWMGVVVFSKELFVTGPVTMIAQCDVYHLIVAINLLYLIPVRHVNIIIVNTTSQKVVDRYSGEIEIPYRFFSLSAEKTFRLPAGNYTITVKMLNSQSQSLNLNGNKRLTFAYVASLGSIFTLMCILAAVISCIGFLVTGRRKTGKSRNANILAI